MKGCLIINNNSKILKILIFVSIFVVLIFLANAAPLPVVGDSSNQWGTILNDFLLVSHNPDGTLNNASVTNNFIVKNILNNSLVVVNSTTNTVTIGTLNSTATLIVFGNVTVTNTINTTGLFATNINTSNLVVTNNLIVFGNITNVTTIRNTNITNLNINGSFFPALDNQFDIGNSSLRWRNGFFSQNITGGGLTIFGAVILNQYSNCNATGVDASGNLICTNVSGATGPQGPAGASANNSFTIINISNIFTNASNVTIIGNVSNTLNIIGGFGIKIRANATTNTIKIATSGATSNFSTGSCGGVDVAVSHGIITSVTNQAACPLGVTPEPIPTSIPDSGGGGGGGGDGGDGGVTPYLFVKSNNSNMFVSDILFGSPKTYFSNYENGIDAYRKGLVGKELFVLPIKPDNENGFYNLEIRELEREYSYFDLISLSKIIHPKGTIVLTDNSFKNLYAVDKEAIQKLITPEISYDKNYHGPKAELSIYFPSRNSGMIFVEYAMTQAGTSTPIMLSYKNLNGEWNDFAELQPRYPNYVSSIVELPQDASTPVNIKATLTGGVKIKTIGMFEKFEPRAYNEILLPLDSAVNQNNEDETQALEAKDLNIMRLSTGDKLSLNFADISSEGDEVSFVLRASGFYTSLEENTPDRRIIDLMIKVEQLQNKIIELENKVNLQLK